MRSRSLVLEEEQRINQKVVLLDNKEAKFIPNLNKFRYDKKVNDILLLSVSKSTGINREGINNVTCVEKCSSGPPTPFALRTLAQKAELSSSHDKSKKRSPTDFILDDLLGTTLEIPPTKKPSTNTSRQSLKNLEKKAKRVNRKRKGGKDKDLSKNIEKGVSSSPDITSSISTAFKHLKNREQFPMSSNEIYSEAIQKSMGENMSARQPKIPDFSTSSKHGSNSKEQQLKSMDDLVEMGSVQIKKDIHVSMNLLPALINTGSKKVHSEATIAKDAGSEFASEDGGDTQFILQSPVAGDNAVLPAVQPTLKTIKQVEQSRREQSNMEEEKEILDQISTKRFKPLIEMKPNFLYIDPDSDGQDEDIIYHSSSRPTLAISLFPKLTYYKNTWEDRWFELNKIRKPLTDLDQLRLFTDWMNNLNRRKDENQHMRENNIKIINISSVLLRIVENAPNGKCLIRTWVNAQDPLYRDDLIAYCEYLRIVPLSSFRLGEIDHPGLRAFLDRCRSHGANEEVWNKFILIELSVIHHKLALFLMRMLRTQLEHHRFSANAKFRGANDFFDFTDADYSEPLNPDPISTQEHWFWPINSRDTRSRFLSLGPRRFIETEEELKEGYQEIPQGLFIGSEDRVEETAPTVAELIQRKKLFLQSHHPVSTSASIPSYRLTAVPESPFPVLSGPIFKDAGSVYPFTPAHIHCFDPFHEFNNLGEEVSMIKAHKEGTIRLSNGSYLHYDPVKKVVHEHQASQVPGLDLNAILDAGYSVVMQNLRLVFYTTSTISKSQATRLLPNKKPRAQIHVFQTEQSQLLPTALIMESPLKEFISITSSLPKEVQNTSSTPFSLVCDIDWTRKCLEDPTFEHEYFSELLKNNLFFFPLPQLSLENFNANDAWVIDWQWSALIGSPFNLALYMISQKLCALTSQTLSQHSTYLARFAEAGDAFAKSLLTKYLFTLDS